MRQGDLCAFNLVAKIELFIILILPNMLVASFLTVKAL
jgi:hypothetical protein